MTVISHFNFSFNLHPQLNLWSQFRILFSSLNDREKAHPIKAEHGWQSEIKTENIYKEAADMSSMALFEQRYWLLKKPRPLLKNIGTGGVFH